MEDPALNVTAVFRLGPENMMEDPPCGTWSDGPIAVVGESPERVSHIVARVGQRVFVLGGKSDWQEPRLDDVRVCDFGAGLKPTWNEFVVDPTSEPVDALGNCYPVDRIGPACVALGSEIWMFAGADGCYWLDDLWMFDTASERPTWRLIEAEGRAPDKRCHHSMVAHGRQIWVFGGLEFADHKNDLHMLDVRGATPRWSTTKVAGEPPSGRFAHSAWMMGSVMYVFGGDHGDHCCNDLHCVDVSDPHALEWRVVEAEGIPPPPRAHVKIMRRGDQIWMYGATRKGLHSNDLWLLDFSSGRPTWSRPVALGLPPCARFGASGVAVDNGLFIFGGYGNPGDGFVRYADTHVLRLGLVNARE